jgi:mannosyltransferase
MPAFAELVVGGYRIGGPSLWRDEAATISGSQRPLGAIFDLTLHQDAVHGAYYLLMHAVIAVGGTSATVLRLPSLIAMSLAAGLTAVLGRRLATDGGLPAPAVTGSLAGLALAAVPLTTRYAQEARPYALTTLFAVLATYLLVRAAAGGRWPWWTGYAVALTVTGLFNLFAVLLALAHGLSLLAAQGLAPRGVPGGRPPGLAPRGVPGGRPPGRSALWGWLASCVAAAVLLAPLAVLSVRQSAQLNWVTRPDPSTVATLVRDFAGTALAIPLVGLLAVLGCVAGRGIARGRGLTLAVVTLPWLVVPPAALLAISLAHPIYVERYVVFCVPALSLLVAAGLVWLASLTRHAASQRGLRARRLGVVAVLPSLLIAAMTAVTLIGPQRAIRLPSARADNLRAVAAVLQAHERPGDAILYLPWDTALVGMAYPAPFDRLRNIGLGVSPIASATLRGLPAKPSTVAARLRTARRVWTVQWTPSQPSVGPAGQGTTGLLTASGFRLVRRWRIVSVFLSLYVAR